MTDEPRTENVLFTGRTHAKILVPMILVQLVLILAHAALVAFWPTGLVDSPEINRWGPLVAHGIIVLVEIVYVVVPFLQWWHSRFTLTDRRVRMTWGILDKHEREVAVSRITQVNVERQLIDRFFGCGTIVLTDAGSPTAVRLEDVPRVKRVKAMLDDLRYSSRR